jgi:hypothetical protein
LLRELRKLTPTVVHFSGYAGRGILEEMHAGPLHRENPRGLYFQGDDGKPHLVSTQALKDTFAAAGSSVRLIALIGCYNDGQAEALAVHVDCVVGVPSSISGDAARSFAIGFYGGLGERESIAKAYEQGCAAIRLEGQYDGAHPKLVVRDGVDANQVILAADPPTRSVTSAATDPSMSTTTVRATTPRAAAMSGRPDVDIGILDPS